MTRVAPIACVLLLLAGCGGSAADRNLPPIVTSVTADPAVLAPGASATLTVIAQDVDGDAVTYAWSAPDGWAITGEGERVTIVAPAREGEQATVTVLARDALGAQTIGSVALATRANAAPIVASISAVPPIAPPGGEIVLRAAAFDPDGDTPEIVWMVPEGWTASATEGETITLVAPDEPELGAEVAVEARDAAGARDTATISVGTSASAGPRVAGVRATPAQPRPGETVEVEVIAFDPGGGPLAVTWVADAGWDVTADPLDGRTAAVVAPSSYGTSGTIAVEVRDARGAVATGEITLRTVENGGPVIVSLSAAPLTIPEGETLTVSATVHEPDGEALAYDWSASDGWMVAGTGPSVAVSAPDGAGPTSTIALTVTDPSGASATASVHVSLLPDLAPVITSVPPLDAPSAGRVEWRYEVVAYDPEGELPTFSLDGAPPTASIDPSTGVLRWSPARSEIGAFAFDVVVGDGASSARQRIAGTVGSFRMRELVSTAGAIVGTGAVELADLDGDGFADLIGITGGGDVLVSRGSATGFLSAVQRTVGTSASECTGLDSGDVDGDGDVDVVVGCARWLTGYSPVLRVWSNDGSGTLTPVDVRDTGYTSGTWSPRVVLADLDRDGDLDAIWASRYHVLETWRNSGTGAFTFVARRVDTRAEEHTHVAVAELTGGGGLDVVRAARLCPSGCSYTVEVVPTTTTLTFGTPLTAITVGFSGGFRVSTALDVVDWDGDGDLDVLAGEAETGAMHELRNDGAGRLTVQPRVLGSACGSGMARGDVDGDTLDDLVFPGSCAAGAGAVVSFGTASRDLGLAAPLASSAPGWTIATFVDDWDRDGRLDVVVARSGGPALVFH